MLADALGRPLRFIITAGQMGDVTQAPTLLEGPAGDTVLADKAYDSNALRAIITDRDAEAVILQTAPAKSTSRTTPSPTNSAIASREASVASSTSVASLRAMNAEPYTSQASHVSQLP
jgi:transposase